MVVIRTERFFVNVFYDMIATFNFHINAILLVVQGTYLFYFI